MRTTTTLHKLWSKKISTMGPNPTLHRARRRARNKMTKSRKITWTVKLKERPWLTKRELRQHRRAPSQLTNQAVAQRGSNQGCLAYRGSCILLQLRESSSQFAGKWASKCLTRKERPIGSSLTRYALPPTGTFLMIDRRPSPRGVLCVVARQVQEQMLHSDCGARQRFFRVSRLQMHLRLQDRVLQATEGSVAVQTTRCCCVLRLRG